MDKRKIYEQLTKNIDDIEIKQDENMANHTSFKVGGKADIFIKVKNIEQLKYILKYSRENKIPLTVIGNGSNLLVKDKGIRGITLQLDFKEIEIEEKKDKVIVSVDAGVKLGMLAMMLQKKDIEGFEFASRYSRNYRRSN